MIYSNCYTKIDLDAIEANFKAIQKRADAKVMAVVKADAYGHGAVAVARLLDPQCDFFGVSSMAEALELRSANIAKPILNLGHTPAETFPEAVKHDVRVSIFSYEDGAALSREALRQNKTARFHFAVDTGMSRIGFQVNEESADICARIARLPKLKAEGLFSHFATADETDLSKTEEQAVAFAAFDQMLRARGIAIPLRHLDNSAGTMRYGCHYEMVRVGIALYGLYPSNQVDPKLLKLTPAMSWHSRVSHVKCLEPGREISYGGTFVTQKPTVVATIPVGYGDGYRRSLSNRFYVLIHGKQAPILGRVCMDQFMVDVTHIPDVKPADPVVLMGTDGEQTISAEDLGSAASSFNYEQICDISRRVPRVYLRHGKEAETVNYLLGNTRK